MGLASRLATRRRIVEDLCEARSHGLDRPCVRPPQDLAGGRLLVYEPEGTAVEGATPYESCGFFDAYDAPPWDTWIWWLEPAYLIAWVPLAFVPLAQWGMDVNSTDCVRWLDETELPIDGQLRATSIREG